MTPIITLLLLVLAILLILTARQLAAIAANSRQHGGLREGWEQTRADNADGFSEALLGLHEATERRVAAVVEEMRVGR